jgi:drug/metabolite transporter (DMT)-like permease
MLIYFVAISRLDVSYVLPIHASSYVLNGLMAWLFLREEVTSIRWLATSLIAVGVFIVGRSEQTKKPKPTPKKSQKIWFFLSGFSLSVSKIWLGTIMLALADSTGDILTAKGIKQVGEFRLGKPQEIFTWLRRVLTNPFMLLGISGNATAFLIFISLLSWADISLIRPATAIGYLVCLAHGIF